VYAIGFGALLQNVNPVESELLKHVLECSPFLRELGIFGRGECFGI
jgi:hypothetical protein